MSHFSIRLRKILLSNLFYGTLFFLAVLFVLFSYWNSSRKPPYFDEKKTYKGTIISKRKLDQSYLLEVKGTQNFQLFLPHPLAKELEVGNFISFKGTATLVEDTYYLFYQSSYAKRLQRKGFFYQVTPTEIKRRYQPSILYRIKTFIYQKVNAFQSRAYLKTFLLGDQSDMDSSMKKIYQTLGISHLFALSGMHISFLIGGLYRFLEKKKWNEKACCYSSFFILFCYLLVVKQSPSIIRASLFFLLFKLNHLYDLHIEPYQLLLFILSIFLLKDPFILEDVAFLYSFSIASTLILFGKKLRDEKKWKGLLKTSCFSFFVSLPISIYTQYEVNFLSIFFNLFFIPLVSLIIFPLSFLVFFFPFLEPILFFFLYLLEKISFLCASLSFGRLTFMRLPFLYYIGIFILFFMALYSKKIRVIYAVVLLCHTFLFPFLKEDKLTMIDIGQGDAFLFESKGQALLLDTGGKEGEKKQDASFLIKFLKSRGISSMKVLLSHGDLDHAGNLEELQEKMKVTFIGANLGVLNATEKRIQRLAKSKNIPFQKMQEKMILSLGNFSFLQLNQAYQNENDSSAVYYVTHQDQAMLFLGDASSKVEEALLQNYDFPQLFLLKLGHHGSKTSTSDTLLENIDIKNAFISSGRNNFYHHPSLSVIKRLEKHHISIYNTQEVGSVSISFPSLKIKTVLVFNKNSMIQ